METYPTRVLLEILRNISISKGNSNKREATDKSTSKQETDPTNSFGGWVGIDNVYKYTSTNNFCKKNWQFQIDEEIYKTIN